MLKSTDMLLMMTVVVVLMMKSRCGLLLRMWKPGEQIMRLLLDLP